MLRFIKTASIAVVSVAAIIGLAYVLAVPVGGFIADYRERARIRESRDKDKAAFLAKNENLAIGMKLPDCQFTDLSGNPVSLSKFLGKRTVISFVSAGCGSCARQMGRIIEVADDESDFQSFVLISTDGPELFAQVPDIEKLKSPILIDETGDYESQFFRLFVFPTNIIVDDSGVVEDLIIGAMIEEEIESIISSNKHN